MDAIEFDGIDPSAPWGTHSALSFRICAAPRQLEVSKIMQPKALDMKGVVGPAPPWVSAMAKAKLMCHSSGRFRGSSSSARHELLLVHDVPHCALGLGHQLSE
eukprot:2503566-Pyramimonas_sp.AAC.1